MNIVCDKCDKLFSSQQTLKTHQLTIKCKKSVTTHVCCDCNKKFSSKQMLTYHQNVCIEKKLNLAKKTERSTDCPVVINKDGCLVHTCIASPSCNLFLHGVCKIPTGEKSVDVYLPAYVEKNGSNFTVSLTPKANGSLLYYTEGVVEGKYFTVHCATGGDFFWHVYGQYTPCDIV